MFVVELAGLQAVVQLAEKSVEQVSLGLVVPVSGGAVLVVEGSGAAAGGEGAESPLVDGVIEAAVAHVAGQHRALFARGHGQG